MKKLFVLAACLSTTLGFAQQAPATAVADLQAFFKQEYPGQNTVVNWLPGQRAVQINEYVYPVGHTTHLLGKRDSGKLYRAAFMLQQGTAVTKAQDSTYRRAYHSLTFSSSKACQQFIRLFNAFSTQPVERG